VQKYQHNSSIAASVPETLRVSSHLIVGLSASGHSRSHAHGSKRWLTRLNAISPAGIAKHRHGCPVSGFECRKKRRKGPHMVVEGGGAFTSICRGIPSGAFQLCCCPVRFGFAILFDTVRRRPQCCNSQTAAVAAGRKRYGQHRDVPVAAGQRKLGRASVNKPPR